MSHLVTLTAIRITRLDLLQRAVAHLENAQLDLKITPTSLHGTLSFGNAEADASIPWLKRARTVNLSYQGKGPLQMSGEEIVSDGSVAISYDSDYRAQIERSIGVNGDRLKALINREVAIESIQAVYGDQAQINCYEENGEPLLEASINE